MSDIRHVMADLETLGTVPGCVGFSVGMVEFDLEHLTLGREFECIINVDSCLDHYLREDQDTKDWWDKQSDEAKVALHQARNGEGMTLPDALVAINGYWRSLAFGKNIRLWGNGADFDNPILRVMFDAAKVKPYAATYGGRCYRTLKNLDEVFPELKFHKLDNERHRLGTYHNALEDAKAQARHLMDNVARIRRFIATGERE